MPKAPILSRTLLYSRIGRSEPPTYRLLDWCLVNTSLGAMMEPRQLSVVDPSNVTDQDVNDTSFNAIMEYDENKLYAETGTSGSQITKVFNT